jgi:hypothetical protein
MALPISASIPVEHLRRLEFLLGEFSGLETLYPPARPPIQFQAHITGAWESCERFLMLSFFGEVPNYGPESFRMLVTYSVAHGCYRAWLFTASQEEPTHLSGDFDGVGLVLVSDPTDMDGGLQRLRYIITPRLDGTVEVRGDRWEPDGYAKYCTVSFRPNDCAL